MSNGTKVITSQHLKGGNVIVLENEADRTVRSVEVIGQIEVKYTYSDTSGSGSGVFGWGQPVTIRT